MKRIFNAFLTAFLNRLLSSSLLADVSYSPFERGPNSVPTQGDVFPVELNGVDGKPYFILLDGDTRFLLFSVDPK